MNAIVKFDTTAHKLLDELDTRHDHLLEELDRLNERVDAVLAQFAPPRPADSEATASSLSSLDLGDDSEELTSDSSDD